MIYLNNKSVITVLVLSMLAFLRISSVSSFRVGIFAKSVSRTASSLHAAVKSMNADQFFTIVSSKDSRELYQIVDVREPGELQDVKLKDPAVINLPLGDAGNWSVKPLEDVGLDSSKPTICVCKIGMRSMKVATFLTSKGFEEVYNLEGGMIKICDTNPQITTLG